MEFDSEEQKQMYDKCKYIVKLWEHKFKKKQGRQPSKLDIREASSEVRNAYKTYFYLKTQTLEKSFSNLEGFQFDDEENSIIENKYETENKIIDVNSHDTYPFSENSAFYTNFQSTKNKIENNHVTDNGSIFTAVSDSSKDITSGNKIESYSQNQSFKLNTENSSSTKKNENGKSDKKTTKNYLSNVSSKFSKRNPRKALPRSNSSIVTKQEEKCSSFKLSSSQPTGTTESETTFFLSQPPVVSTKVTMPLSQPLIISAKENTSTQSTNLVRDLIENKPRTLRTVDADWLSRISQSTGTGSFKVNDPDIEENKDQTDYDSVDSEIIYESEDESNYPPSKKPKIIFDKIQPICSSSLTNSHLRNTPKPTDTRPDTQSLSKTIEKQVSTEDKIMPNNEKKSIEDDNKIVSIKNGAAKDVSSKNDNLEIVKRKSDVSKLIDNLYEDPKLSKNTDETTTSSGRVLRSQTKPRSPDAVQVPSTSTTQMRPVTESDYRRKKAKEIFEKKLSTGNLNENFIKVNLKKKTYSRGKRNFNYSNYKKKFWKRRKAEMNSCDVGDNLLPVEACESDALPTLEEASEKAKMSDSLYDEFLKAEIEEWDVENKCFSEYLGVETNGAGEDETACLLASEPIYKELPAGTPSEIMEALQKFGYSSFRTGQEAAVTRILAGKSTLVTLSTGTGKSLCYLLPAYLYSLRSYCITLVVSPLVSLMDDQVTNVPSFLKAACYHSNQTRTQRDKVKDAIVARKISLLFLSPELLVSGEKSEGLKSILNILPPIAFACIDEAHCVSQWSHNFRPSYLLLCKILRESLNVKTLLGLTATATKATRDSIREHFNITDEEGVISDIPLPDNLSLTVSKVNKRDQALLELLSTEQFSSYKSIIVYCNRRQECERVAKFLRTYLQDEGNQSRKRKRISIQAECYHAGLSASKRRSVQKVFMSGELRIVVATVAFGMGINKSDIRAVIHYNMPSNVESYVQEVGRAGRDRLPAHCHVFLDGNGLDKYELRRHAFGNSVDRHTIRKLLKKVFIPCKCEESCPKHETCFSIQETVKELDLPEENIATILCYLELHPKKYITMCSPAYSLCKITYPEQGKLKKAAQGCAILAKAILLYDKNIKSNMFEFPVVEVASSVGLGSGFCKHKLKNLEWFVENNKSKRSPLNVSFSNLGFRMSAIGNLSKSELDDVLNCIYDQAVQNEKTSLLQLEAINYILLEAQKKESGNENQSDFIKNMVRDYFSVEKPLENYFLEDETFDEQLIVHDVKALVSTYRDTPFTGRAIARIFHGLQSPNFTAYSWGRTRFWRSHFKIDFHAISKIATREILDLH